MNKTAQKTLKRISPTSQASLWDGTLAANPARAVEWVGGVSYENLQSTLNRVKTLMLENPHEEIQLLVNSYGGVTGVGLSFYDSVRSILKPNLTTIGSGDVNSSGIIVFLAGYKRYLTPNTSLLLHLGGRTFGTEKRFSTADMEDILREDKLKDYHYACVVSDATLGRSSPERILELMANETVLTAQEAVQMGLAHRVL